MAKTLKTGSDFTARVVPPASKTAATTPPYEPRNRPGHINYVLSPAEEQLIERVRNPKCSISAYGQAIAENIVRRNVATTEGMTSTEVAIFKRLAIECGVPLELKASP